MMCYLLLSISATFEHLHSESTPEDACTAGYKLSYSISM